jgi:hypothetical protein
VVDALFYNFAFEGRPMDAALRANPIPDDVVARLFHAASLLREHRGDGHIAALTDDLAAKPYECLESDELDELMATLEPLAALLLAAQDW